MIMRVNHSKARFRCRSTHVPNLIELVPLWSDIGATLERHWSDIGATADSDGVTCVEPNMYLEEALYIYTLS